MFLNFVLNWRKNLLLFLLFVAALLSFSFEQGQLCAGWWLEHQNISYTRWETKRKKISLPTWYNQIHSTIGGFRSLMKKDRSVSFMYISLVIIAIGSLFLLSLLISRSARKGSDRFPEQGFWVASLKGTSKIIRIGIAVSMLSSSMAEHQGQAIMRIGQQLPEKKQHYALLEDRSSLPKIPRRLKPKRGNGENCQPSGGSQKLPKRTKSKNSKHYSAKTEKQMKKFFTTLSEKDKRRYAGVEALKLGTGGISYIAKVVGCSRKTVSKGLKELQRLSSRSVDQQRIRKKGGGRKPQKHAHIDKPFLSVLKDHTAGDPMVATIKWTNLSVAKIARLLALEHNIKVSPKVVKQLLYFHDYRRRKVIKNQTMKQVRYRNEQFENITRWKKIYHQSVNPIISMDTKKKEYIGNFYRNGYLYTREVIRAYDHDFTSFAQGVIIPHTLYDLKRNFGFIHLGTSKETSEFACDCIKNWWLKFGCFDYPDADSILILCDGGGSNSSRHYIFKQDLQKLVDEIGIEIRIAHFPPYTSNDHSC